MYRDTGRRDWRTGGHAGRSEPGMHRQILTPSHVRPEAQQPAANSPAPRTVSLCQALLSGCSWGHAEPYQCCVPLDVSCRGSACGRCSCLSLGKPAAHRPLLPCGQHRGHALPKGPGALSAALYRAKRRAEPLQKWLSPILPTGEQQRRLACRCTGKG